MVIKILDSEGRKIGKEYNFDIEIYCLKIRCVSLNLISPHTKPAQLFIYQTVVVTR